MVAAPDSIHCNRHGSIVGSDISVVVDKSNKIGYRLRCKICARNRTIKWENAHRDEKNRRSREYRKSEKGQEKYREHYALNKDKIIARTLHYRFGDNREAVIARDGYKCLMCGMTRDEHIAEWGCDITVDHIDGNGRLSKNPNNDMNNLQTLCYRCHGKKDAARRKREKYGQKQ